jgi:hypothetical protein
VGAAQRKDQPGAHDNNGDDPGQAGSCILPEEHLQCAHCQSPASRRLQSARLRLPRLGQQRPATTLPHTTARRRKTSRGKSSGLLSGEKIFVQQFSTRNRWTASTADDSRSGARVTRRRFFDRRLDKPIRPSRHRCVPLALWHSNTQYLPVSLLANATTAEESSPAGPIKPIQRVKI